jgi:uncharacterized damage-inducible protein DinB
MSADSADYVVYAVQARDGMRLLVYASQTIGKQDCPCVTLGARGNLHHFHQNRCTNGTKVTRIQAYDRYFANRPREESMTQAPIWFERKFEFSFPPELLPNLCARLRGTPARLEDALRGRSHKSLIGKPQGKWSAQEHAGHLLDLEPLWLARVGDYVAASDQLTAADLQNRKTDEANHNARPLEQILTEFREERERLLNRVGELDASLFNRAIPHPRLKTPMRLVDHLYFVAEHDDHHLARIWELVNAVR